MLDSELSMDRHKAANRSSEPLSTVRRSLRLGCQRPLKGHISQGLKEILIPQTRQIIYRYTYADALRDKVIVLFQLKNIVFET